MYFGTMKHCNNLLLARIINTFSILLYISLIFHIQRYPYDFFSTKNYLLLKHSSAQCQQTMWIFCRTTNTDPTKKEFFPTENVHSLTWYIILFSFSRLPCCCAFLLFFHSFILSIRVLFYFVLVHCSKTTIQYSSRNLCIAAVVQCTLYTLETGNFSKILKKFQTKTF